jgi:hypothetical protein
MTNIYLTVEADAGVHVRNVIKDCIAFAQRMQIDVRVKVNGIVLHIGAEDDLDDIFRQYQKAIGLRD